ncbi:hypothetical protein DPMN_095482 [Dreissena polymorpha]|uniref:Uncharacterized protein n=1 Tax=Dreissena polymorpha TaxID=45954 RepID=A0A9D4R2S6_DREPO|nr:hypothetical protein DPMN_095482 [Dreissena polymorpha]
MSTLCSGELKKCPALGSYVFQANVTIFELIQDIIETNLLTIFHEDLTINVASRVLTRNVNARTNPKTSPEQSAIFQLVQEINKTNAKYVTSIVFNHKASLHIVTTAPTPKNLPQPPGSHAKNVTSRVKLPPPPPGSHVIQLTGTIFQLNSRIKETNVKTKFHENWAQNVSSRRKMPRPLAAMFFSPIWTIFELVRHINKTNVLINFHDDWAKIATSRVFTRKTAPPTGGHVHQQTGTTFELNQHIIKTDI